MPSGTLPAVRLQVWGGVLFNNSFIWQKKEKDEHLLTSLLPNSSSQRYSSINKGSEDLCIIVCFSFKKKVIKSVGLKGSEPEEESRE